MKNDVFISYANKDQKIVEGLSAYLEQNGIRCFIAYRDIPNGVDWAKAIVEAIENCKCMVAVVSDSFNSSPQTDKEIGICVKRNKNVLSFKIQDVELTGSKLYNLNNVNWIDAFPNPKKHFGKLLTSLHNLYPELNKGKDNESSITNNKKESTKNPVKTVAIAVLSVIIIALGIIHFCKSPEVIVCGSGTVQNYFKTEIKEQQKKDINNIFFFPLSSFTATMILSDKGFAEQIKKKNFIFATSKKAADKDFGKEKYVPNDDVKNILEVFLAKDTLYIRTSYSREYCEANNNIIHGDTLKIKECDVKTFLRPYLESGNTLFITGRNSGTYSSYNEFVNIDSLLLKHIDKKRVDTLKHVEYFKGDDPTKFQHIDYFMLTRKYYDPSDENSTKIYIVDNNIKCKEEPLFLYIPIFQVKDKKIVIPKSVQKMLKQQCGIDSIDFNNIFWQSGKTIIENYGRENRIK